MKDDYKEDESEYDMRESITIIQEDYFPNMSEDLQAFINYLFNECYDRYENEIKIYPSIMKLWVRANFDKVDE